MVVAPDPTAARRVVVDPDLLLELAREPAALADPVSDVERRMLEHVCSGATDERIAQEFGISRRTVQAHLAKLRARLGCDSRAALVRWAVEQGY